MVKLFAFEEDNKENISKSNMLILDKLIENTKKEENPLSLTADILEQKKKLESEIEKNINKKVIEENKEESKFNEEDEEIEDKKEEKNDESSAEKSEKEENKENIEDKDNEEDIEEKDNEENDKEKDNLKENKEKEEENEESDLSKISDSKDSLKSIIGTEDKEEFKSKNKEDKKEITKEKFKTKSKKITLENIFTPISHSYAKYTLSLEDFNIKTKLSLEEQPVVFIKEDIIKSLNNFINTLDFYKQKNDQVISSFTITAKNLNEKLTILTSLIKNKKFHFTNLIVNDFDILGNILITNNSNLIEISNILIKYLENSNNIVTAILKNDFNDLSNIFTGNEFKRENSDLVYSKMLPGFNIVKVYIDTYSNFSKVNLNDYNYYIVKILKMEDLYNLNAIFINKDKDINNYIEKLNILLVKFTSNIDTLNILNTNLNKLLEEVKALIFDIEQNKFKKLTELDIDNKVKNFIKFKILFEIVNVNINIISNFILQSLVIINKVIELKN